MPEKLYKHAVAPGVLVHQETYYPVVAQLLGVMLETPAWRERLVARQKQRITVFSQEAVAARLLQFLEMLA